MHITRPPILPSPVHSFLLQPRNPFPPICGTDPCHQIWQTLAGHPSPHTHTSARGQKSTGSIFSGRFAPLHSFPMGVNARVGPCRNKHMKTCRTSQALEATTLGLLFTSIIKTSQETYTGSGGKEGGRTSRNFWLISLRRTGMPTKTQAVAMPEPMRPPPNTATFRMGLALRPPSVTPFTFFVDRCAKNMCTSALCVSRLAAFANAFPSCPPLPSHHQPANTTTHSRATTHTHTEFVARGDTQSCGLCPARDEGRGSDCTGSKHESPPPPPCGPCGTCQARAHAAPEHVTNTRRDAPFQGDKARRREGKRGMEAARRYSHGAILRNHTGSIWATFER